MRRTRSRRLLTPVLDPLDQRCLLSGYTPGQIANAYGYNAITIPGPAGKPIAATGAGQTIALIEAYHDPTLAADLHQFDLTYHLPDPNLQVADLAGNRSDSGWAGEETLDVEWAHALAPGANILVIEAASQSLTDLMNAVQAARSNPAVSVVSMSWGFNDMPNEASYDPYFTTPSGHQGITFIAASGDSGTVEYPASSPNVLSVGGTSLFLSASSAYGSETAWYSGGGGYSVYEAEPTYQAAVQTTGKRSTPDVAFDADPNTGVMVYQTVAGVGGSWQVVGGTSLGAPAWAALIALVDQARTRMGRGTLDGTTQTLPALYAAPSSDFHQPAPIPQITGFPIAFEPFGYPSNYAGILSSFGPVVNSGGANTETGLGSPNAAALETDLVESTLVTPVGIVAPSAPGSPAPKGPLPRSKQHHKTLAPHPHSPHKPQRLGHPPSHRSGGKIVHQHRLQHPAHIDGLITRSSTVWKASGETLNSPLNGLSIAAVKNTNNPIKIARIAIRQM